MKKVLILGAGLVAKPMVEYLLEKGFRLMIASPMLERAIEMIRGNPNGSAIFWSMDDPGTLEKLVSEYDLTVSLLPYKFHSSVAKVCLRHRKHLVTTSYVQSEIRDMDHDARKAGILFLNEIGLDPGIDHMSAMKIIDHIHVHGGKVEEFYSLCGALPAPEAADNPFRYRFTWSPKGVVLAGMHSALYLKNGNRISISPENLFRDTFNVNMPGIGILEVYPNRDSMSYIDIYGIPETNTMYRGTFRYKGWCILLDGMKSLGMLDETVKDYSGMTCRDFIAERSGSGSQDPGKHIITRLGAEQGTAVAEALEWLGFFGSEKLAYGFTSPFEITSDRMIERMSLDGTDRDMIIMQHTFLASWPSGRKEVIRSSMLDFGTPATNTAIARTVALPAAIAVNMIFENKLNLTGVHRPVVSEIYNPVLDELKELGIEMKEEYGLPESEMI